jgi:site-specific recombinase XerD
MAQEASELRKTQRRYLEAIALLRRPNTVTNSRTATNAFIAYLESEHPELSSFSELNRSHIDGWLRHLAGRPLRRSTRRNLIIKVRRFVETLQEWGWEEAPEALLFRRGDLPPEDKCLPKPLSEDVDKALQEELSREDSLISKALLLARLTGVRSQELLDLKVDDLRKLSADEFALHVPVGKLHDDRVIPLSAAAARLFVEIRELRGDPPPDPETGEPWQFLLVRQDGKRYTREALRKALKRAERRANLREHPTPHRLRHNPGFRIMPSKLMLERYGIAAAAI